MDTDEPVYLNLGMYGIPDRLFGPIAQDLAICVGLVTMLGALAEGKVENPMDGTLRERDEGQRAVAERLGEHRQVPGQGEFPRGW